MLTVIARWEDLQMPEQLEWRMWRQLRGFGIGRFVFTPIAPELSQVAIEQYETMEEALAAVPEGNRVFLEPTGYNTMYDLPDRNEDVVFILGNTQRSNMEHANVNETYRISAPMNADMYPTSAASIALAYWHGQ